MNRSEETLASAFDYEFMNSHVAALFAAICLSADVLRRPDSTCQPR